MSNSSTMPMNETHSTTASVSLPTCWQARDAWWKCLDLYDNREWKCQKQIEQLHNACSSQLIQFFEERRAQLMQGKNNRKYMLPAHALHTYMTDFRNNANHNFSSHQTGFPFDDDDDDDQM